MRKFQKSLYGISFAGLAFFLSAVSVRAQTCVTPPTCASLGYSKSTTECKGVTDVLKCPFDTSIVFCITEKASDCSVGDILFADKSCYTKPVPGRTAIGVVFDKAGRKAVGFKTTTAYWATENFDIPALTNFSSFDGNSSMDYSGRTNTISITAYCKGQGKSCPAAEYVNSYVTEGTSAGDWYLPTETELLTILANKAAIHTSFANVGGVEALTGFTWSSSENNDSGAWGVNFSTGTNSSYAKNYYKFVVRPVLRF